ncbi:hypothetical protein ACH46_05500 [Gordonia phthalatica]|uniref:HTH lysR-type domain-containing protein n=2 Tax=Gordonia phthalatica TaxID=1136941 RepID=A0A0N9N6S1_9ACTN|nr:hypothetical protein ACH46_05500 [Gordonia phthalatica]
MSTRLDRSPTSGPGRETVDIGLDDRARRHPLDLRRLEQFVTVVEVGSLTDAATELGVTQQALSAAIRTLEKQLCVTLFVRTRGMQPSAAGIRLYEAAQALLAGASRTVRDVQAAARGHAAALSIGYTPAMKAIHAYDLVAELVPRDVPLELIRVESTAIREQMAAGDVDIAFCHDALPPEGLAGKLVGVLPINVALRTEDAARIGRDRVGLSDLAGLTMIRCRSDGESVDPGRVLARCRELGFDPDVENIRCLGLEAVSMPLATTQGFAFVSDEVGVYFRGRVTVVGLRDEIVLPVQAVWLRESVQGLAVDVITSLRSAVATPSSDLR